MSRAGYSEDLDPLELGRWRGQVMAIIRGKHGQSFLKELLAALDAMPDKRLIAHELEKDGDVCALGSLGKSRGMDMSKIDPEDYDQVAGEFGIAHQLAREIEYVNDEYGPWKCTPEQRFEAVRKWVVNHIRETAEVG